MKKVSDLSFQPQINQISQIIDEKISQAKKEGLPRWEFLYELSEKQKEDKNIKRMEKEELEKNEISKYSFQPNLNNTQKPVIIRSRSGSVEKRTMQWSKVKNEKIRAMADFEKNRELSGCTFKPQLCQPIEKSSKLRKSVAQVKSKKKSEENSPEVAQISLQSMQKYVQKQKKIREEKCKTERDSANMRNIRKIENADDEVHFKIAMKDMHKELLSIEIPSTIF